MNKEYCRVSIEETQYQNWLEEDVSLEELELIEADHEYDALMADEE